MSDLIPDEEREPAITEAYNTITGNGEVEWGPEATRDALEKLWDRARPVSPVTREDVQELITEAQAHLSKSGQTPTGGLFQRMLTALESLSVSPPAEVEWEYGEFSKDDIQEDGSIHPWAEPLDTWETPPTGDDLIDLADVGSVCARRMTTSPWVPVSPESEGKK